MPWRACICGVYKFHCTHKYIFCLPVLFYLHFPHQGGSFGIGERLPASYYSGPVDSQAVLAVFGVTELQVSTHDCTAHSAIYSPATNSIRALNIFTDTWCSSGQFRADGTLVQTGGNADGFSKVLISFTYYNHFTLELTPTTANLRTKRSNWNVNYLYSHSIVGHKNSLHSFLQATCPSSLVANQTSSYPPSRWFRIRTRMQGIDLVNNCYVHGGFLAPWFLHFFQYKMNLIFQHSAAICGWICGW